jgi:hypothetical protein
LRKKPRFIPEEVFALNRFDTAEAEVATAEQMVRNLKKDSLVMTLPPQIMTTA